MLFTRVSRASRPDPTGKLPSGFTLREFFREWEGNIHTEITRNCIIALMRAKDPTRDAYSSQFWLVFTGLMISSTGTTMIWPFIMIFASEKLALPLAAVTSLMALNSASSLLSSLLAGGLVDQYGRRSVMVLGLVGAALVYLMYIPTTQFWHFSLLMILAGFFTPLYRVGTDTLLADMVAPEQRAHAYGIFRMGRNIGVAIGPILGGLVLSKSYTIGLIGAGVTLGVYGLITYIFVKESRQPAAIPQRGLLMDKLLVYRDALRDRPFLGMLGAYTLMEICAALIWVLLAVYMKQNFGLPEARYSVIPTTNALMVVFLQVFVTRRTSRSTGLRVMPLGAFLYAAAMAVVGLSNGFWGFWIAMVVLTWGELITAPTATAYVANLAPADKRGSYLGLFGLTWYIAMAIGPLTAGIISDSLGIRWPWFLASLAGVGSVVAFVVFNRRQTARAALPSTETQQQ